MHTLELFFTLSHTLPLHDSHLNAGFLNAELQANWHEIKPIKWLIKFNLTNRMHEYEMKCFSKTLVLNPDLPKLRFSINFSLNSQTTNTFCIKIK